MNLWRKIFRVYTIHPKNHKTKIIMLQPVSQLLYVLGETIKKPSYLNLFYENSASVKPNTKWNTHTHIIYIYIYIYIYASIFKKFEIMNT